MRSWANSSGQNDSEPHIRFMSSALPLVSASQITMYRECPRKWAWRYIAGLKTPTHPAAALGIEVDDTQLQPYLREGRPLDLSRESGLIAEPGLVYLPKGPGLEVQKHFTFGSPTSEAFGFQGYIDLWMPKGGMPDTGDLPTVVDFKTTGNWKYAKTADDLRKDVQAQLYATWAMWSTGARVVDLVWIYFATRGPRKAKRVHLRVVGDDVGDQFAAINATAVEMFEVRQTCTDPLTLKPSVEMCEAYGGCPFRANCKLSPGEIVDAKAAQWMRRTEETTVSNTTTASGGLGALARLRAQKAAAAGESGPPVTKADFPYGENVEVLGINPPEKDLPPAPPVGVAVAEALVVEPPKRGRPKKTEGEPLLATGPGLAKTTVTRPDRLEAAMAAAARAFLAALEGAA